VSTLIEIRNLSKVYERGAQKVEALHHVNLDIANGDFLALMAFGALFGVLNTMYSAVAARAREIATLRAIGFRRVPMIVCILVETMLLAVTGGVIGAAVSWAIFDDFTASTVGVNSSQMVFAIQVSPALLWNGLKWALAISLVGGLFPAVRAARMSITAGLREL
jgi:putative ABC transport system permease protein